MKTTHAEYCMDMARFYVGMSRRYRHNSAVWLAEAAWFRKQYIRATLYGL